MKRTVAAKLVPLVVVPIMALSGCGTRLERVAPTGQAQSTDGGAGGAGAVPGTPLAKANAGTVTPNDAGPGGTHAAAAPARGSDTFAGAEQASPQASNSAGGQPAGPVGSKTTPSGAGGETAPARHTPSPARPAGPTPAPGVPTAPDRSPFVIASVGTLSGPAGTGLKPGVDALQAWAKWTNDRGGLKGHPVTLITADDGGDPARHRSIVQDLVERRSVLAFVHNTEAVSGQGSVDYLAGKGIPVIGSDTGSEYFNTNPNYFPQAPSSSKMLLAMLGGTADLVVPQGRSKVATVACTEAQICRDAERIWSEEASAYGLQVVSRGRVSLAQPDYTAECLSAKSAGAEVVMFAIVSTSMQRFAASCARQGIKFTYSIAAPDPAARIAADPNFEGSAILGYNAFPWTSGETPATAEFQDVIAKYLHTAPGGAHAYGWVSAKLFERAASAVVGAPSTKGILHGLWSIKNDDLGGLTAPLTFAEGAPASVPVCWFPMAVTNAKWVTLAPHAKCR